MPLCKIIVFTESIIKIRVLHTQSLCFLSGLESSRPNLILGLVICQKGKRPATETEKMEEKRSRIQTHEEAEPSLFSKGPPASQEKKTVKYTLY